jgi:hypothetical protein
MLSAQGRLHMRCMLYHAITKINKLHFPFWFALLYV